VTLKKVTHLTRVTWVIQPGFNPAPHQCQSILNLTVKNITSGFKVTGIYPVDRNAVQISGYKLTFRPESLAEKSGLAYIPLYSPALSCHSQKERMTTSEVSEMSIFSDNPH